MPDSRTEKIKSPLLKMGYIPLELFTAYVNAWNINSNNKITPNFTVNCHCVLEFSKQLKFYLKK